MPSYLIDFYDFMTFYTNILLVNCCKFEHFIGTYNCDFFNKHIAWNSILINSILDVSDIRYSIQSFLLVQASSLRSLCAKSNSILQKFICFES